ncbi:MAG: hypothetical protein KGH57_04645 [Candidatus Micrarchaeota archaeon]|nr:hypothetical protein [Candidatus Micrarchaeota archaeon]
MEPRNKAELKGRILRLLSVDARISMQDLANSLKTTKVNAYGLFNEVANEYGLRFVPEISIDKLWKWEFIKRARLRTKRGILAEAVEELPLTGFGEYLVFVKFVGKKPADEEIVKATGSSYAPQFMAKTKGEYDLVIYAVERSYEDAVRFTDTLSKNLGKYRMLAYTMRVWGSFGFFPLSNKLIEQFDIFDTYKNLLFGLNEGGRNTFTDIGKHYNQGPAQMLYAYDRLARTEILRRVTYFESKPKNSYGIIAVVKTQSEGEFENARERWFVKLTKDYEKRENECVFMCDTPSPKGLVVIADFPSKSAAGRFLSSMRSSLKGAEVNSMQMGRVLAGGLGVRDFDMRYTSQYKRLERKKMVPSMAQKMPETPIENPNAID